MSTKGGLFIREPTVANIKEFERVEQKKVDAKTKRINVFRRNASRLASKANKRIERLERNDLKDSPAYRRWVKDGSARFGIRGKTYNEVQAEVARMERFLNAQTSTVRGAHKVLRDISKTIGQPYVDMATLKKQASNFFTLASKAEQYLRHVHDMGSAFDSNQIFAQIRQYVKQGKVNLESGRMEVDDMVKSIADALTEWDKPIQATGGTVTGWYTLPKE